MQQLSEWRRSTAGTAKNISVPLFYALNRATALMGLREKHRRHLSGKPNALVLLDALFANPYITAARAQKILGVSSPTARQVIATLAKAGMLKEASGRKWGQWYVARPILNAINREK